MKDQLNETVACFEKVEGECVSETVSSPAKHYLRYVDDTCEKLAGM